jgi:septal ring factor EnvC (AmiA/AmiB activator)
MRELRPVSFRLKRSAESKHTVHFGFIAQELEKVLPEVVTLDKASGLRRVMYQDLIAVLALALQQQDSEVRSLRKDVAKLQVDMSETHRLVRELQTELKGLRRQVARGYG